MKVTYHNFFKKVLYFLFFFLIFIHSENTSFNEAKARKIIKGLQKELYQNLAYSKKKLSTLNEWYPDYYKKDVLPKLKNISKSILKNSIHWVNLDYDKNSRINFFGRKALDTLIIFFL